MTCEIIWVQVETNDLQKNSMLKRCNATANEQASPLHLSKRLRYCAALLYRRKETSYRSVGRMMAQWMIAGWAVTSEWKSVSDTEPFRRSACRYLSKVFDETAQRLNSHRLKSAQPIAEIRREGLPIGCFMRL